MSVAATAMTPQQHTQRVLPASPSRRLQCILGVGLPQAMEPCSTAAP